MYRSLVPRLLPSFLAHTVLFVTYCTVQYATKSWGGAWERGYDIVRHAVNHLQLLRYMLLGHVSIQN